MSYCTLMPLLFFARTDFYVLRNGYIKFFDLFIDFYLINRRVNMIRMKKKNGLFFQNYQGFISTMTQYKNVKSRLAGLGINVINSTDDFETTKTFFLECSKGHRTEQKNTSMINRFSAFSQRKCSSICGTCCHIDGILEKILPFMKEKGFELVKLEDDHINLIYKCICGHEATSNTKNIKKTKSCIKCHNQLTYFLNLCQKALETDFEVVMTFKDYLEDHNKIRYAHKICGQEFFVELVNPMEFVCQNCKRSPNVGINYDQDTKRTDEKDEKEAFPYGYQCIQEGCPYYAIYLGTERPLYCDAHYPDEGKKSVYVGYRKGKKMTCIAPKCTVRSTYNDEDGMRPIFCKLHKQPKMINVISIKCVECKEKTARYNYKKDLP